MTRAYLAIGGTVDCQGGVEVFMARLRSLWPATGLADLVTLQANSAWAKTPLRLPGAIWRWVSTLVATTRLLRAHARESRPVALWYHYSNGVDLLAVWWYSRLPGVHLYLTPHCGLMWRHLRSRTGRWLALRVARRATAILVLSQEQRQFFEAAGTDVRQIRTLLAPSSAPVPPFEARPARSLVFAGRVSREKGAPEMIAVLQDLLGRAPDFVLDIYGPVDEDVARFVEDLPPRLRSAIRMHGAVPAAQVREKLSRHRYLLHLSRVDAFPLAVLEAIVAGTYPVTLALPGTCEIIDAWGGIAATGNEAAQIAQSIWAIESAGRPPDLRSSEAASYYAPDAVALDLRNALEVPHATDLPH